MELHIMRTKSFCIAVVLLWSLALGSCQGAGIPGGLPLPGATLEGRVVDPAGAPVAGARVLVPGMLPVVAGADGRFILRGMRPTPRLAVSFTAPGFVNTTRVYRATGGRSLLPRTVLLPRARPVVISAADGGRIPFARGGGLTLPGGGLVDGRGQPVRGDVRVSLTYLDVADAVQLAAAPGDFTAEMRDGSTRMIESFGMFELFIQDSTGARLDLAPGRPARFELPIRSRGRGAPPRVSTLFSFDTATGRWMEAGTLTRAESAGGLTYSGTITRVDWSWNADEPVNTTCITLKILTVGGGGPEANAYVTATGVNYSSVSSGYTDANGLVCLLVKRNEPLLVRAYSSTVANWQTQDIPVQSPDISSGAADCGDESCCPLVQTIQMDVIVG
jgi:hypothetical protein